MAVLRAFWRPVRWLFATWPGRALLLLGFLFLAFGLRLVVPQRLPEVRVEPRGSDTLVVILHGMGGNKGRTQSMLEAVERHYPGADRLVPAYATPLTAPFSNIDAYELANAVEQAIHQAYELRKYKRIVLVGYSMGALLMRKTIIWAYGHEEDRIGRKGPRDWVKKIDRVVSLAGMSRGWSIDPAPTKMSWDTHAWFWLGEKFGRLTGTGQLILSMQRGAPFVADSRVQWIRLVRKEKTFPPVVHLLGDRDDIVSIDDSRDLAAAKGIRFVTIAAADHASIVEGLETPPKVDDLSIDAARRRAIDQALGGNLRRSSIYNDKDEPALECPPARKKPADDPRFVTRIVYIMHGIRDYADWADHIRAQSAGRLKDAVIVPAKYGYFAMIPFLLYADRHENVRWFMDAYTDHLAGMPCLERVDYVGHSNGTYILASALQHYKTLEVNRVYFAGSVVPKHYPWIELGARVKEVNNVVASDDWVVALFPRLFEQVAEWLGTKPVDGPLDIGSAGFRGFDDGADGSGKVRNIKYATGSHGAGVDVTKEKKLGALVDFVLADKALDLTGAFVEAQNPRGALSFFSNISWAVWLVLASALAAIAWLFWHWRAIRIPFTARTFRLGRAPFVIFVGVVGLLFFSI